MGYRRTTCCWMSLLFKYTFYQYDNMHFQFWTVMSKIVCNEFERLLCPNNSEILLLFIRLSSALSSAILFINAIGHPLSLDARPHKATLVAPSRRHCHVCAFCWVCIPSHLQERKNRFMWHTCAPRGSDRKRMSVPPPLFPWVQGICGRQCHPPWLLL